MLTASLGGKGPAFKWAKAGKLWEAQPADPPQTEVIRLSRRWTNTLEAFTSALLNDCRKG